MVCSQVFDHTSVLQFLESIVKVREPNISSWRRAVCGDLSSCFQPAAKSRGNDPDFPGRDAVLERIHKAQFRPLPASFRRSHDARQEPGVRPSLPLPYELYAAGALTPDRRSVEISLEARKGTGAPFHVYTPRLYRGRADLRTRAYAVEAGKKITDTWDLEGFDRAVYSLAIHGPNGFLRELSGSAADPAITLRCDYKSSGDLAVLVTNTGKTPHTIRLANHMYKGRDYSATVKPGETSTIPLKLAASHSWFDFTLKVDGADLFTRRCAGRVETGRLGFSDPVMGGLA